MKIKKFAAALLAAVLAAASLASCTAKTTNTDDKSDGKETYTCPIRARNLSGRTGRGDTTFAAYINERLNYPIEKALLIATATVSLKMETPGPIKSSRNDIEKYINRFYSDYSC